jgi:hypothetical protein
MTRRISTRRFSTRRIEQLTASYAVVLADARPLVKLALVFSAIVLADGRPISLSEHSLFLRHLSRFFLTVVRNQKFQSSLSFLSQILTNLLTRLSFLVGKH